MLTRNRASAILASMHAERERPLANQSAASAALAKVRPIFQQGDLWHAFTRFPDGFHTDLPRVDRLKGILSRGILPPSDDPKGIVSDFSGVMTVTGMSVPYDSVVFLHRHVPGLSEMYALSLRYDRMAVLVDRQLDVRDQFQMGRRWIVMCQDEVYASRIPRERFVGLVVHPSIADGVVSEFLPELERLAIPVYDFTGKVLWPSDRYADFKTAAVASFPAGVSRREVPPRSSPDRQP